MARQNQYGRPIEITKFIPIRLKTPPRYFNLNFGKLGFYGILAVSLLSVWYVLTARSVSILTLPETASINIISWPSIKIGSRWLLRAGNRELEVTSDGYYPFVGQIKITSDDIQTHQVSLIPLPGNLDISLQPVGEADLYIDGEKRGKIPNLIKSIAAGQRQIEARADRYLPFEIKFLVEGRGATQNLDIRLEPAWANVQINSRPATAEFLIDGKRVGITPLKIEVLQGNKTITLKKSGYKDWTKKIRIRPSRPIDMGTIALSKSDGYLRLTSIPEKVTVLFNDEFKGETPVTLNALPEKNHVLKFTKKGYRILEKKFKVESNVTIPYLAELIPELAPVYFSTIPKDAELIINGESKGFATQVLELPTFEHEITIRRKGYATYQTKVTPRKNFEKRIRIRLKTVEEAQEENLTKNTSNRADSPDQTYTGQKMKLFENVNITLGSGKKDRQRQRNEPLRRVVLKRPFYLSETEVSNGDYRQFIASHFSGSFGKLSLNENEQPVSNVSWMNAVLFCNWLSRRSGLKPFYVIKYGELLGFRPDSTGYRLPTEAEWEWAQISETPNRSKFSWGEEYPPPSRIGNFADESVKNKVKPIVENYNDGFVVSAPVGSFSSNSKGLYDLDGNVAEWVHDFYDGNPETSVELDPLGPIGGSSHVVKGSSWKRSSKIELRGSFRLSGTDPAQDIGFRIARYAR